MKQNRVDYFPSHEHNAFPEHNELITYSFNNTEKTIVGVTAETDNRIYIYEYRGKLIGTEFFISFSKDSVSYKLIKVDQLPAQTR